MADKMALCHIITVLRTDVSEERMTLSDWFCQLTLGRASRYRETLRSLSSVSRTQPFLVENGSLPMYTLFAVRHIVCMHCRQTRWGLPVQLVSYAVPVVQQGWVPSVPHVEPRHAVSTSHTDAVVCLLSHVCERSRSACVHDAAASRLWSVTVFECAVPQLLFSDCLC